MSVETRSFLSQLAKARARQEIPLMRKRAEQAWRMRWGAILPCTSARAVASSLLNVQSPVGADGDTLSTHEVERDYRCSGFVQKDARTKCSVSVWATRMQLLHSAAEDFARGETPASRPFFLATMTVLRKKDGGVCGIASASSSRRLVAKTLSVWSHRRAGVCSVSICSLHEGWDGLRWPCNPCNDGLEFSSHSSVCGRNWGP